MTTKPNLTRVWASGAPGGNIEDPDVTVPGKFAAGWEAEIPPFENFNFLQQLFTQGLAHANEYGIMQWDTDTEYPLGGWARSTVDDEVYVSLTASNQGNEPSVSASEWSPLSEVFLSSPGSSLSVDLDTLIVSGTYSVNTGSTNNPTGNATLIVLARNTTNVTQTITGLIKGDVWVRTLSAGIWTDWKPQISSDQTTFTGDLDTIIDAGFYSISTSATNNPTGNSTLIVNVRNITNVTQTLTGLINGDVWVRTLSAGVWTPWKEQANTTDAAVVISSGSNANGEFRIWSDGFIECWHNFTPAAGGSSWTFPVAFTSPPTKVHSNNNQAGTGLSTGTFSVTGGATTTTMQVRTFQNNTTGAASPTFVYAAGY